ncbi:MAG: class I SAM-dependent methyltransferase [Bacteroidota bacterium]
MRDWLAFLQQKDVQQFIKLNEGTNLQKLILNPPKFKSQIRLIADQLQSRQKAKGKLNNWLSKHDLIFPPPLSVEQASSEKTAEYKERLLNGTHLIDLTGGAGVDCLHLSKNFNQTTYVEENSHLCEVFTHNVGVFNQSIDVVNNDSLSYASGLKADQGIDFFVDPARRDQAKKKVFKLADCSPNLLTLLPILKVKGKRVLVKLSPILDLKSIMDEVSHIGEIHVVSVKNECKELLLLLDFRSNKHPTIKTVNLSEQEETFDFQFQEETDADLHVEELKTYLYEANSSILKAGAFKLIGNRFEIGKVARHTHLYTSDRCIDHWPGKIFKLIEAKASKAALKRFAQDGRINVVTRNYPINAKELKHKFKLKDGGDYFLIGMRGLKDKPHLVIAKRIIK